VPCVYALLEDKTQESYERLLHAIESKCITWNYVPDPTTVIVDFESATIRAVKAVFGDQISVHGCFYHLTQSTWRKVQAVGKAALYKSDENFRLFIGMLDGLAFLPVDDIEKGMVWLKSIAPDEATDVLNYFDQTYVTGVIRELPPDAAGCVRIRRTAPLFPPSLWNVNSATLTDSDRTNNVAEGWNNRLSSMVGHHHPSIWTLIEVLQADAAEASATVMRHAVGNLPPRPRQRATVERQRRMRKLCEDYGNNSRQLESFMRAVGHTIRFSY